MPEKHVSWEQVLDATESPHLVDLAVQTHIRDCRQCSQLAAKIRKLLSTLTDARLPNAPESLRAKAWEALRARLAAAEDAPIRDALHEGRRKLREICATLIADSLRPSLAVRGSAPGGDRTLLYETPDLTIALSLSSGADGPRSEVLGQVTPKQGNILPDEMRAVAQCGDETAETTVSNAGDFTLCDLPGDPAEVDLHVKDTCVRLTIPGHGSD